MSHIKKTMFGLFAAWSILSAVLLICYMCLIDWIWQGLHYLIWPLFAGILLWRYSGKIESNIQGVNLPLILKYALAGYLMVLTEEVFAATFNHLSEGFEYHIYFARVGQFWMLNILAFSGIIWGSYAVYSRYKCTVFEMFCTVGLFGQISERLVFKLFEKGEAIAAITLMPLNFLIYGTMFWPMLILLKGKGDVAIPAYIRAPLTLLVIFVVSIPFVAILDWSRAIWPNVYPPRHFVP